MASAFRIGDVGHGIALTLGIWWRRPRWSLQGGLFSIRDDLTSVDLTRSDWYGYFHRAWTCVSVAPTLACPLWPPTAGRPWRPSCGATSPRDKRPAGGSRYLCGRSTTRYREGLCEWGEWALFCHPTTELCKNIPDKFRESLSKCSTVHPKTSLFPIPHSNVFTLLCILSRRKFGTQDQIKVSVLKTSFFHSWLKLPFRPRAAKLPAIPSLTHFEMSRGGHRNLGFLILLSKVVSDAITKLAWCVQHNFWREITET